MPTALPRILVSLPVPLYDTLRRVSAATDQSMSNILRELLTSAAPVLESVADVCERAKAAKAGTLSGMAAAFQGAEALAAGHAVGAMAAFDSAVAAMGQPEREEADKRGAAAPERSGRGRSTPPPSSNTGVRLRKPSQKRMGKG